MTLDLDGLLEEVSFLCARDIKRWGDLTPMEIEALYRGAKKTEARLRENWVVAQKTIQALINPFHTGDQ